jgi:hypothetical protein
VVETSAFRTAIDPDVNRFQAITRCRTTVNRMIMSARPTYLKRSLVSQRIHSLSGKRIMKPSRFGIRTLGSVWAFIVSFSPMSLLIERMYAVNA